MNILEEDSYTPTDDEDFSKEERRIGLKEKESDAVRQCCAVS